MPEADLNTAPHHTHKVSCYELLQEGSQPFLCKTLEDVWNFRGYAEIIFIRVWNILSVCFLTLIESKLTAPKMPAFFFFIAILTLLKSWHVFTTAVSAAKWQKFTGTAGIKLYANLRDCKSCLEAQVALFSKS